MRFSYLCPPDPPLPYAWPEAGEPRPHTVELAPGAVAAFDALVHEIHPDARRADPDRIEQLAQWLTSLPPGEAAGVIERRLQHAGDLGAMLADDDWDTDEALRLRARKLLDYLDQDDGLIPNSTPCIGLLDDALLIELTWPAFAEEVENHLDFCDYRKESQLGGVDPAHRAAWLQERLDEAALWRHELAAHEGHFAEVAAPPPMFRVT